MGNGSSIGSRADSRATNGEDGPIEAIEQQNTYSRTRSSRGNNQLENQLTATINDPAQSRPPSNASTLVNSSVIQSSAAIDTIQQSSRLPQTAQSVAVSMTVNRQAGTRDSNPVTVSGASSSRHNSTRQSSAQRSRQSSGTSLYPSDDGDLSLDDHSVAIYEYPSNSRESNPEQLLTRRAGLESLNNPDAPVREETKVTAVHHLHMIEDIFDLLAKEFAVYFETEQIISAAVTFSVEPATIIVNEGSEPSGVYIVLEGLFSFSSPGDGGVSLNSPQVGVAMRHLSEGEMFGEVATLIGMPNITTVTCEERGVLLRIPADVVGNSMSGKILKTKARAWCVRRAHIYTSGLFDHSVLVLLITAMGFKSTKEFKDWSYESLDYMSRLCQLTLFNSGDVMLRNGDLSSNHLFVVVAGRFEVTGGGEGEGSRRVMAVRNTCESCCVGDREFFQKTQRLQTVTCLSPLLAIPLCRETLMATIEEFTNERPHLESLLLLNKK